MKTKRVIENILLVAGLAALNIWIWSNAASALYQGWENWAFDHEVNHRPATVHQLLTENQQRIAARLNAWLESTGATNRRIHSTKENPVIAVPPAPTIQTDSTIGRLTIPRLHLSAMVREGAGEETLSLALGHIPHTALPGQPGNVGVAGHRDRLFRGLRNIKQDDLIVFETLGGKYSYQVKYTTIVKPQDVSVLHPGQHAELTLVTCYPFYYVGSAPQRFIVKAQQVSPATQTADAQISAHRRNKL